MNIPTTTEAHLPKGVADFLPEKAAKIGWIEGRIRRVFELWGFRRIIPPLLEYSDVIALGTDEDLREKAFRFDDRHSGKLLVIPPDITPQVARIVATRMKSLPLPHRLYYEGRVLRQAEKQAGRSREIFQAGVELIGLDSPEADAEMIAMAAEVLNGLGLSSFRLGVGHVGFFRGIIAASGLGTAAVDALVTAISKKDSSAVAAIVEEEGVPASSRDEIVALPRLFGGRETINEARRVVTNAASRAALENLEQVVDIAEFHGVGDRLTIDLGEIRGFGYHTGVTFEAFIPGLGEPLCGGGRYDTLTARYGFQAPATGFAFNTLALLAGLERRPEVEATTSRDFLLFNRSSDRRAALAIAQELRSRGFSVARDIIRRGFDDSLTYAKKMNIRHMLVTDEDGSITVVAVWDGSAKKMTKEELLTATPSSFRRY